MNRREFELVVLGLCAVAINGDRPGEIPDFGIYVCDRAAAAAVGERYLRAYPEERDRRRLLEALSLPGPGSSPAVLARALERRIRADFAAQRTVLIDGWLLARAEAAICALIALG
jgi:hypothetical protein